MGARSRIARAAGRACSWAMKTVLRRGATTLPGRVALAVDPRFIGDEARKIQDGSIVVCGTNGKTTTTNILARAIEASGRSVLCNRAGANMESGVAAALLPLRSAQWGVFENDELSTVRIVPQLKPRYVVLLNLFRDQLDRCGELDRVQRTVADAVVSSPGTALLCDADDPLCKGVAEMVRSQGGDVVTFGIDEDLHLPLDRVTGGGFCQLCGEPLDYAWRHYGQLGNYRCTACSFARGDLDFYATEVSVGDEGVAFTVNAPDRGLARPVRLSAPWGGTYMVYNLLAAFAAAFMAGVSPEVFQGVLDTYRPENGRLQRFDVAGREVTLNLAKNPTGFNQNMALLMADTAPKAVYIVINDDYNDGKDVSWLWDVDFELLARTGQTRLFVGGHRANDMQVRLKYADLSSEIAEDVAQVVERTADLPPDWHLWVLTNYSALWPAKAQLEQMGASR